MAHFNMTYFDPAADSYERAGKVVGDLVAAFIVLSTLAMILHNILA